MECVDKGGLNMNFVAEVESERPVPGVSILLHWGIMFACTLHNTRNQVTRDNTEEANVTRLGQAL